MLQEHNTERAQRIARLEKIRQSGIDPYPADCRRTHEINLVRHEFAALEAAKQMIIIAGRIISLRRHGGSSFLDLDDGSGRLQVYFKKDQLTKQDNASSYQNFQELIDSGDFLEVSGTLFKTKQGEETLLAAGWRILSKAILPLPTEWFGIKDAETRYRKRYLDLLLNEDQRALVARKSKFWNSMREFLLGEGFIEVYTPVLENTTGGADARPFITHHNALDIDVYLRISMGELWQKRLMVAGFPKTFEIGRQFRNEGIDPEHLQDYTQMEYYWAYANYEQGMDLTTNLIRHVAQATFDTLQFEINGQAVDLAADWLRIDFRTEIQKQIGIDVRRATLDEVKIKLKTLEIDYDDQLEKGRLVDLLWKYCRKNIAGPAYLIGLPVEISPLAKRVPLNPEVTERFQLILAGTELCNGYSELNDPLDQRARFIEQARLREAGDEEAQMNDEEFVEALEHGMPPVCGLGISERLFSFLEGKSIRECTLFPLLRPAGSKKNEVRSMPARNASPASIAARSTAGWHSDAGGEYGAGSQKSGVVMSRDEAMKLLRTHIKNENLIRHHLAVEAQMQALARYFEPMDSSVNSSHWALAGLVHDIDWEQTADDPTRHSQVAKDILRAERLPGDVIDAVYVHNHLHGIEPRTLLEKALFCAEELTGLIVATALVQPDRKLSSVDADSIIKKFKDKAFARGVNRQIILKSKDYLNLELKDLIHITLPAMQAIAGELGL